MIPCIGTFAPTSITFTLEACHLIHNCHYLDFTLSTFQELFLKVQLPRSISIGYYHLTSTFHFIFPWWNNFHNLTFQLLGILCILVWSRTWRFSSSPSLLKVDVHVPINILLNLGLDTRFASRVFLSLHFIPFLQFKLFHHFKWVV
jgi:hypothetical protein